MFRALKGEIQSMEENKEQTNGLNEEEVSDQATNADGSSYNYFGEPTVSDVKADQANEQTDHLGDESASETDTAQYTADSANTVRLNGQNASEPAKKAKKSPVKVILLSLVSVAVIAAIVAGILIATNSNSSHVVLGQYKNFTVTLDIESMVQEYIDYVRDMYSESEDITDRTAQEGDWADVTFVGYVDGVQDDNCSAEGYALQIGSGSMIDGFEEALIGMKPEEEKTVELVFPSDYRIEDYRGKNVTFELTMDALYTKVLPEFNDEFVKENYSSYGDTVEEFKDYMRSYFESMELEEAIYTYLEEHCQSIEINEAAEQRELEEIMATYEETAEYYGMEAEDLFYYYNGMTPEDYVHTSLTRRLIIDAVRDAENLKMPDSYYNEKLDELAELQGTTTEELVSSYGEEALRDSMEISYVYEFIKDTVTVEYLPPETGENQTSEPQTALPQTAEPQTAQ